MQQSMDFGKRILKRSQELRRVQECLRVNMIALTSKALRLNMITTRTPRPPSPSEHDRAKHDPGIA